MIALIIMGVVVSYTIAINFHGFYKYNKTMSEQAKHREIVRSSPHGCPYKHEYYKKYPYDKHPFRPPAVCEYCDFHYTLDC